MNRLKKIVWIVWIGFFWLTATLLQAQEQPKNTLVVSEAVVDENGARKHLIDEYGVFDKERMLSLEQELRRLSEEKAMDLVVVFVQGFDDRMDSQDYQDLGVEFIKKYGYGKEKEDSVGLMIIDMENRWIQLVGDGNLYNILDLQGIRDEIIERVGERLREYDYSEAVYEFVHVLTVQYERANRTTWERFRDSAFSLTGFAVALIVSLINAAVFMAMHNHKDKIGGLNYEVKGSFSFIQKEDAFRNVTTRTRKIPGNRSGGGGRSTNNSGGGYSGGGGRF